MNSIWYRQVNLGNIFIHSGSQQVGNDANYDHLLVTPANKIVDIVRFTASVQTAPFEVYVYEAPAVSANGTPEPLVNMNMQSDKQAQSILYHQPTVTGVGDFVRFDYIPGAKQTGGIGDSGQFHIRLKPSTAYLLRLVNKSGGSAQTGLTVAICERPY